MDTRLIGRALVPLVLFAGFVSACGVEGQDEAQELDADSVPFDLLDPEAPIVTVPPMGNFFVIFLVDDNLLADATRAVRGRPTVARALRILERGPTSEEFAAGLSTAIPPGSEIQGVAVRNNTAIVDVSERFEENVRGQEVLALAQVVYMATGLEGVNRVRFRLEGEPTVVPRGNGTQTSRPVDRNDFPQP
ncbi:MAG: GerMN domain-containing protein [Acidimicrobiia bacterium]